MLSTWPRYGPFSVGAPASSARLSLKAPGQSMVCFIHYGLLHAGCARYSSGEEDAEPAAVSLRLLKLSAPLHFSGLLRCHSSVADYTEADSGREQRISHVRQRAARTAASSDRERDETDGFTKATQRRPFGPERRKISSASLFSRRKSSDSLWAGGPEGPEPNHKS